MDDITNGTTLPGMQKVNLLILLGNQLVIKHSDTASPQTSK